MSGHDFHPFAHLTTPNVELYRQVMAVFVVAKRRFTVHLRPEDVHESLPEVDLGAIVDALGQLKNWGNLRADPDTSRVTTVEDFHRARYLYQLTTAGEAAELALTTFDEALGRRGALQAVALADIVTQLRALLELARAPEADPAKVHLLLRGLVDRFTDLADNAQAFMGSLQRSIDLHDVDAEAFRAYKDRLIDYLERFKGPGDHGRGDRRLDRLDRRPRRGAVARHRRAAGAPQRARMSQVRSDPEGSTSGHSSRHPQNTQQRPVGGTRPTRSRVLDRSGRLRRGQEQPGAAGAKPEARKREDKQPTQGDTWWSAQSPPSIPELARTLWEAAAAPSARAGLLDALAKNPALVVEAAADLALQRAVVNTWPHGWLPYDLFQIVRRELGDAAVTLLVDTIACEAGLYEPATVHPRWRQQLDEIGAVIWWDSGRPHLGQWATRHRQSGDDTLGLVVLLLRELMFLTELPVILPLPGTAKAGARTLVGVDQKVLGRVRGLLAKAESTEFSDEAEALSAKAQELMNRHAFDRAVLDAEQHVAQSATSRRLWLDNPYLTAKSQLVHVVAEANRCRAVAYDELGFVALVGDEMDLEITELLSTSLLVQATRAMVSAGSQTTRTGQSRTRSFRQSFLISYATRIGERLRAATGAPEDERLLPVLRDRQEAVDELFGSLFTATVEKSVSVSNAAGWGAGRAAADVANLGVERTAVH